MSSPISLLCAVLLLASSFASATTLTFDVNSTADDVDDNLVDNVCHTAAGTCSLRAALMQANTQVGNTYVVINIPAGHYLLSRAGSSSSDDSTGSLKIKTHVPVFLVGAASATTIIDANSIDRVIDIRGNTYPTISGVTITGGNTTVSGGGIEVERTGTLSLSDSRVSGNSAFSAGGISAEGDTVLTRVTISNNAATSYAGGIDVDEASVTIDSSTISNNSAATGAGVYAEAQITVVNSTIANNSATVQGAGMFVATDSPVDLYNVTIAYNKVTNASANYDEGGGIWVDSPTASVGIYNSLIAKNLAGTPPQGDDCTGNIEGHANDAIGTSAGCTIALIDGANVVALSPAGSIGPLADNGGPTQTVAPLSGSNAIDGGYFSGCVGPGTTITVDQRGVARPQGAACDLGAVEVTDVIFANGFD
jgi:CSLREA domain-containing protein